jgi:hypothetical protein
LAKSSSPGTAINESTILLCGTGTTTPKAFQGTINFQDVAASFAYINFTKNQVTNHAAAFVAHQVEGGAKFDAKYLTVVENAGESIIDSTSTVACKISYSNFVSNARPSGGSLLGLFLVDTTGFSVTNCVFRETITVFHMAGNRGLTLYQVEDCVFSTRPNSASIVTKNVIVNQNPALIAFPSAVPDLCRAFPTACPTSTRSAVRTRTLSRQKTQTRSLSIAKTLSRPRSRTLSPAVTKSANPSRTVSVVNTKSPVPSHTISQAPTVTETIAASPSPSPVQTATESLPPSSSLSVPGTDSESIPPSALPSIPDTESESLYPSPSLSLAETETESMPSSPSYFIPDTESESIPPSPSLPDMESESLNPSPSSSLAEPVSESIPLSPSIAETRTLSILQSPLGSPQESPSHLPIPSISLSDFSSPSTSHQHSNSGSVEARRETRSDTRSDDSAGGNHGGPGTVGIVGLAAGVFALFLVAIIVPIVLRTRIGEVKTSYSHEAVEDVPNMVSGFSFTDEDGLGDHDYENPMTLVGGEGDCALWGDLAE